MDNKQDRKFCEKHPTYTINPKYGKCFACRIADGDVIFCKECEKRGRAKTNYHDKRFEKCFECFQEDIKKS